MGESAIARQRLPLSDLRRCLIRSNETAPKRKGNFPETPTSLKSSIFSVWECKIEDFVVQRYKNPVELNHLRIIFESHRSSLDSCPSRRSRERKVEAGTSFLQVLREASLLLCILEKFDALFVCQSSLRFLQFWPEPSFESLFWRNITGKL